jgi:hypothetical protein
MVLPVGSKEAVMRGARRGTFYAVAIGTGGYFIMAGLPFFISHPFLLFPADFP